MRKTLLLSAALLGLMAAPASAATVGNLGVNPTSRSGDFSSGTLGVNGTGAGSFTDFITFQLVGTQFVTITSATNVYPNPLDFITDFTGSVYQQVGVPGGGDDILRFGPQVAQACITQPDCQVLAGSGILEAGNYFLQISGIGGGQSGYGGNLAVTEVPLPPALALFVSGLVGIAAIRRQKQKALEVA